jgi:hypothetical protein
MVSVLVSSEIDRRFETRSIGQLEDCTIGIFRRDVDDVCIVYLDQQAVLDFFLIVLAY